MTRDQGSRVWTALAAEGSRFIDPLLIIDGHDGHTTAAASAQVASPTRVAFRSRRLRMYALRVRGSRRHRQGQLGRDRDLSDLVGELSTRSDEFRTRWAAHNVRIHRTGVKRVHHPIVGDLDLTFEMLQLSADPGVNLLSYSAEPGTPSEELGSWVATLEEEERARASTPS